MKCSYIIITSVKGIMFSAFVRLSVSRKTQKSCPQILMKFFGGWDVWLAFGSDFDYNVDQGVFTSG